LLAGEIERPEGTFAILFHESKFVLGVEIARRSIFLRRQEPTDQALAAALGCAFCDVGEERGFDGAADDAAA
jgi:hypothetical protein